MYYGSGTEDRIASGLHVHSPDGSTSAWNDVMAAILKVWRHIGYLTMSIDVQLREEQSCQISTRSDLQMIEIWAFFEEVAPNKNKMTSSWSKNLALRDKIR